MFPICSEKHGVSGSYRCMYNTPPKLHVSLHGPDNLSAICLFSKQLWSSIKTVDSLGVSVNWIHIHDLVLATGKTKEVYCCDIVVLIVLFWCFWCVKDYNVISVYWNIVWWGYETISINWLVFSFAETRSIKRLWSHLTERICPTTIALTTATDFLQ